MRAIVAIFKKEMSITFASPIFYAAAFIFLVLSGYFFYSNTAYFGMLSLQAMSNPMLAERLNLTDMVVKPFFGDLSVILLLMTPLITMRLYAEEKKTGTIELLFTYPISNLAVLTGKFCATLLVLITMLAGTIPYLIILESFGTLEWGVVISGYFGVILMGGSFIALGTFTSSLTENQIVAAVMSFGALLLFWVFGWAGAITGPASGRILEHISIIKHLDSFARGLIDSRDVIFYLLFIFFWLFLTLRFLNSRYWRG
ncbi:MAG: ABC transporter permease subunit [Deltaproteobacteria bacterium]|nr:ABC transporter permease subunit [Deltaproteobacteria bacterium]MBW2344581.1 ABC transporter permease subunit [Deltaproteobacteria bacterium]